MKIILTNSLFVLSATILIIVSVFLVKDNAQEIATLKSQQNIFEQNYEKQIEEQRSEDETNNRELMNALRTGVFYSARTKTAQNAVVLAKAAEKAGYKDMARTYYLSAVSHAPTQYPILSDYANFVISDPATTTEDISLLKSVLQLALYQISPEDIKNARQLMDRANNREKDMIASETPKSVSIDWKSRFEKLKKSNNFVNSWNNLKELSDYADELKQIVVPLKEEKPNLLLLEKVEDELNLTQRILAASQISIRIDTIMKELDSSSNQPEKSISLLQTAEATLGQLWGIDSTDWPKPLKLKIDSYPKRIQSYAKHVADVKSAPFVEEIHQAALD